MVKWNTTMRKYEPYTIPEDWNCPTDATINTKINCSNCGKEIRFYSSYISHEIINESTRKGYPICELCRIREIYNSTR